MKRLPVLFLCLLSIGAFAQKKHLNKEFQVENDNDAYTFNLTRDQYYSNGVALRFRYLTDSSKWADELTKKIRSFELNHRVYSPRHLFWEDSADMDRPYAGQLTVAMAHEYYFESQSYLKAKLELGWMGPALRTGDLQYNWHRALGMQLPLGWQYEINDAPIINAYGTYAKTLLRGKSLDLTAETNIALGTTFSHLRQEFLIRWGNSKPIQHSTQYNGVLGIENNGPAEHEIYVFISPGIEFVEYNATIEGNRVGKASIYTETAEPWVFQMRAGLLISWTKFDFGLILYRRTKETTEAQFHKYVGIRLNHRF